MFKPSPIPEVMEWEDWKVTFPKKYMSAGHHDEAQASFMKNIELIKAHNARTDSTYRLGVNQFSDLSAEQFSKIFYSNKFNRTRKSNEVWLNATSIPDAVDWRTQNAVTPVKNQGQCGSCWAFSTTGSTEGRVAIATKKLNSLSEQQLVDCAAKEGNHGCGGGLMDFGFQYIMDNHGIDSEGDYPYEAKDDTCQTSKAANHVAAVKSFADVPANNQQQFLAALAEGPVSIAIEADQSGFQQYRSGIFSGTCGTNLDHGVLAVGYDQTAGYWIVKNSWGTVWGEQGYIRFSMSTGGASGMCGMLKQGSYPVAGTAPPSPGPSPGPTSKNYEDPYTTTCSSGEVNITISGVAGAICTPSCTSSCPSAPAGFSGANAQCALQNPQGSKYCALICDPTDTSACDPSGSATCKSLQGTGICTYDNGSPGPGPSPSPSPGPPYDKPNASGECGDSTEIAVRINGIDGDYCAPSCSLIKSCPQAPTDIMGTAQCALQDASSGAKYCAIICIPNEEAQCDESAGMTCKSLQGVGICTYDSSSYPVVKAFKVLRL